MEKSMELAQISGRMTLKTRLKALQVRGLMMATTAALMAAPALATGENTDSSSSADTMQVILGSISYIKTAFVDVVDIFVSNPLFVFYIALGILSSCVGLFWRMKRAARR